MVAPQIIMVVKSTRQYCGNTNKPDLTMVEGGSAVRIAFVGKTSLVVSNRQNYVQLLYDTRGILNCVWCCRVNCSFFFKIGACRHGERCSRLHNKPTFSQTIMLQNLYLNPNNAVQSADKTLGLELLDFFKNVSLCLVVPFYMM
jgi:hypothetical protein